MTPTPLASFTRWLLAGLSLLAALASGCSGGSSVVDEAEAPPASAAADTAAPEPSSAPPVASAKPADTAPPAGSTAPATGGAKKAGGSSCDAAGECESGVCEGEGCGAGQGKCTDKDRKCTMDLRQYCGCDGKTFQGGGNCPKGRFSKRGPCDGDPGPGVKFPAPKKP